MMMLAATDLARMVSGDALLADCASRTPIRRQACRSYIAGVVDARRMPETVNWASVCEPEGMTREQLADIVVVYLRDNPSKRRLPASDLVLLALQGFPCVPVS
ncbi:Rap1a/Tai family immunity protein [Sphingomonas sp. RT2P30]|uniref:Rap1a/Tai family immunity protein n=1 Tax=Parasphingomonas halimpatiens TaxID=3096162 RepID=UPI002FCB4AA0